ncbi:MAG: aspartate--tRNA ligase [Candidatus Kerfeldbacteria bacterium CG08_land_8_20_14_0_20_43_14]|uniref:Aspartate--tRNA ligase n=1 Tax=Candidatus Kerfeldbacteria bacterium CG08_land_8_20_14_0_20_43_14 TaxID=2014246 RepID=A0A2H0YQB9_9BACT|nr:MAG: aspartate--tRNA ligase [Candidatus Kerfeldbacteria bacterium CG08_land_8_20_14_0_20_43_14]
MERLLIKDTINKINEPVLLKGWVHNHRRLGKMVFMDLRDRSGIIQVLFMDEMLEKANQIRPEWVVEITGKVVERTAKNKNESSPTGGVEIHATGLKILSEALTPPFPVNDETKAQETSEDLRMKYRYLDLRRSSMRGNLVLRAKVNHFIRNFLTKEDFLEVETPFLTKGTPEGAREYIVPARNFPGKFYVLPQSPQQFKQLLMIAGIEKYFQIAKCFRDEDQRADRQPEFTQLDLEISFTDQEEILNLVEKMVVGLVKETVPEKHITQTPFPRIPHKQAMEKYGTDKPDIRKDKTDKNELGFAFIIDFPLFEYSEAEKKLVPSHHLFTSPQDPEAFLHGKVKPEEALSKQYDLTLNGFEVAGGSIRIHDWKIQEKVFEILKIGKEEAEKRFGHMKKAFEYGVPPHGGIAMGLDRLIAVLAGESNIREIMAFPKTNDAKDLMTDAPTELPKAQLDEAHIQIKKK